MKQDKGELAIVVFEDGTRLENGVIYAGQRVIAGEPREALEMRFLNVEYELLTKHFVDGARFWIEEEAEGGVTAAYDKADYAVAGPITDNRDGSFTVLMGCRTQAERLRERNAGLLLALAGGDAYE